MIAVVAAVIGAVTTIALRSYLVEQKDEQLYEALKHSRTAPPARVADLRFVGGPGHDIGTVGGRADGPTEPLARSGRLDSPYPGDPLGTLSDGQLAALSAAPRDGDPHTVPLPGLGDYRVLSSADGRTVLGFPLGDVQDTVTTLVWVEVSVTAAGLVAAGIAGGSLVGVALRPLRRVAATATRVSELRLHSGEVALHERVPGAEADPRTEVGQVGAALNRMLDHVHAALDARQESETRVRQFVADASHELRTPLASIRGYAELTRRGQGAADTRRALDRIEAEATRMTGLVEDLLLLARLDAGRPLGYAETDLAPLVVDAVSDARAAGQEHLWRLDLPSGPDPVAVHGDAARLQQVLVNLLANARTHTPPGTTVTARVRSGGPHGREAVVEVEDDGPGIPPDLLPHVFQRFARGDSSRSRHSGSTGLGLAIVRAVVTAHGGRVDVTSEPGRTVFSVRLPVRRGVTRDGSRARAGAQDRGDGQERGDAPVRGDSQAGHSFVTRP
ncbi:HAMP domain-containing histidine kinase [Streptomyces sp. MUM 203J]|nr:HAMP domain-containing histidine kinase [Streptomyces sp. MUM 203J]